MLLKLALFPARKAGKVYERALCDKRSGYTCVLIGSAIFKASSFMINWMKKHNLSCGNFAAEMYYDTSPDASYMELWLPLSSSQ